MTRQTVGSLLEQYLSLREKSLSGVLSNDRDLRQMESLKDRLLVNYSPLVKYIVGKTSARATHPTHKQELMSSGILGLLNAIETYDPHREVKFETYAISKIRWSILDELRKEDRISRRVRAQAKEAERAKDRLAQRLRRPPNESEISKELGISLTDYRKFRWQYSNSQVHSLDEPYETGTRPLTTARQISSNEEGPTESLERQETYDQLVVAMGELNERERTVVTLYFYEGLTLREIGQALELTEGRISQIMRRTLGKLRDFLPAEEFIMHGL